MSEIKEERNYLTDFLKTRIQVSIAVKGESLVLDAEEEKLLTKNVKVFVKRFLHQRGLSEAYRVIEEREVIRVAKRKHREERRVRDKGTEPSSYDTLPYYFPNRP
jgi:hypothetical protein